ncbi:MAG TPA: hypothetical protein VM555_12345, partial [Tahibacter sp.]|nr:hypothetical protein [Tahibacter sp.]
MHDAGTPQTTLRRRFAEGYAIRLWLALIALFVAFAAPAQVQRTFVNLGFELPSAGASTCYFQIAESAVPGW